MAHRNARLTPVTRLEMVLEVEAGWSQAEVARRFRVSRPTVAKWVRRFRRRERKGSRAATPPRDPTREAPHPSWSNASAPCAAARGSGRTASPGRSGRPLQYAVLRRFGLNRLDRLHRVSRRTLRYEHPAPGDLLHIDVKKLGRIPEGGGHRVRGRSARTPRTRGLDYVHVAVDDHSRYAYVAVLPDERGPSCAAFLEQALAAFGRRGVRVRGVLTRQREGLHRLPRLPPRGRRGRRGTAAHPALPPADERQGRALHPDPAERVGLRPPLPLQRRAAAPAPALALPLQCSPAHGRYRPAVAIALHAIQTTFGEDSLPVAGTATRTIGRVVGRACYRLPATEQDAGHRPSHGDGAPPSPLPPRPRRCRIRRSGPVRDWRSTRRRQWCLSRRFFAGAHFHMP